jgi:phosphate transport system permease protein
MTKECSLAVRSLQSPSEAVWQRVAEWCVERMLLLCSLVAVATTFGIIAILILESAPFFTSVSLSAFLLDTEWTPLFSEKRFGIWPLFLGTLLTSGIAVAGALPIGLIIAVYLSEFATVRVRAVVKPIMEVLAGLPTILYGYFAFLCITPLLRAVWPEVGAFNALSAGLVMAVMILPTVVSLSEDALYMVPHSLREGAYALGASRLQMIVGSAIPAAFGGITAAFILAVSRAVGETMIVAIAAGQQPLFHLNPLLPVETMTAYIVQISQGDTPHGTVEYHTLFAVAVVLFGFTLLLSVLSVAVRQRYTRMFR